ncbi:MAG TPA: choice-of-anchor tandem repeat NxxGxxAF-containing protein [Gemmataceae bacterium]|nr:choice-of-anchor tandem repeat NxxGxxAF-containing protein [Gemmataceae bacterium]
MRQPLLTRCRARSHTRRSTRLTVEALDGRRLPSGYTFEPVASLGDPALDSAFSDYFQIGGLNNRGDVAFVSALPRPDDGSFRDAAVLARDGQFSVLALTGEPDPAGVVFGGGVLAPMSLNDRGDVAFAFNREPFGFPVEINSGLYRDRPGEPGPTAVALPGMPAAGGGTFAGISFGPHINARGDIAFAGVVPTDLGPGGEIGLGVGLFEADRTDHIRAVVRPGGVAPGGETFDWAAYPWSNQRGDIAFMGHTLEQGPSPPPEVDIFAPSAGVYRYHAGTDQIEVVARPGDPSPDGGVFEFTFFPRLNNHDLVFAAWTSEQPGLFGVFAESEGTVRAMVSPGDPLPGGGHFVSLAPESTVDSPIAVNGRGDVEFLAILDTDDNKDGRPDPGLYQWSNGSLGVVARTGTTLPGLGTVRLVRQHDTAVNDRGQIAFWARLTDRREVLLIATPASDQPLGPGESGARGVATGYGLPSAPPAELVAATAGVPIGGSGGRSLLGGGTGTPAECDALQSIPTPTAGATPEPVAFGLTGDGPLGLQMCDVGLEEVTDGITA